MTVQNNALGQKTSLTLKNNNTPVLSLGYEYYANGWLKKVTNGTTPYAAYQYDAVGNRTRVDLNNNTGAYTTYAYTTADPRYLLETIGHYDRSDTQLLAIGYARDSAGNPTSIGNEDYTYDANNRLDSQVGVQDWNYDWVGNRVNPPASPNPMVYNAADQLTSWPEQHQYTYLGTGSLEHQKDSTGANIQKTYTYTAANLLSSVTHDDVSGDPVSSMIWDADSNRISFTSSEDSGMTRFVYDPTAGIPAVIEEVLPSTSSVYYVREPNGSLIARVAGAATSYYHFDALGSTRLLTNASGTVTDTYSYDAWGNTTHDTGSMTQPYQYVGQLGYYTHYQDANLALLELGVRFYDPALGRFTQTSSPYEYAGNNPVSNVQPQGKSWWDGVKDKLKGWWPWGKPDKDPAKQYLKDKLKDQVTKMLKPPFDKIADQLDKTRGARDKRDAAMAEVKKYAEDMRNDNMDKDYRYLSCFDACIALFDYLGVTTGAKDACGEICNECNP